MRLKNSGEFFEVLDKYVHIKAVIWGHVHQEFNSERNGVRLMATPSTCVQFMPGSDEYQKDGREAGYRYLKLNFSGKIETDTRRLNTVHNG
jgi:3',5'-cyclic-AMP phosphodiesterase